MDSLIFQIEGKTYALPSTFPHPGGQQVLNKHSGEDVTHLFKGTSGGHVHSDAAWALLQHFDLEPSMAFQPFQSTQEGIGGDGLIDESKPLLAQVWKLGPEYHSWVHKPVAGQPRFFHSSLAEMVTKVKWWIVPVLWLPLVVFTFHQAIHAALPLFAAASLVAVGLLIWQLVEYCIHRFVFHARPATSWGIFLHFLFHGCHHKYPTDVDRLVFPPIPASPVIYLFYSLLHTMLQERVANSVFSGMLLGYVAYDCMHYFQHSGLLGGRQRAMHMHHHYVDSTVNYGISSRIYDILLGTSAQGAAVGTAAVKAT